ncbi:MAG: hypothetical protein LBI53_02180 [Candidatus Peribacteria bacterium]|jgi:hypothetical protein|nr:hypothetical protein [Candidatus Peribacteria bacterium]
MLPFYWNISKIRDYTFSTTKNASCKHGTIALDTMKCTFHVYNGESTDSEGKPVYEIIAPCFTE